MDADAARRYADRRQRVLDTLGDHSAMVLPAAPELRVGRDFELRYRPDPDLLYVTGCDEPEAVAVLAPAADEGPFTIFVRPRDPERERWTGPRAGPEAAAERYGADAARPIDELDERLPELLALADTVYFRLGTGRAAVERAVRGILIRARRARQKTGRGPRALVDPGAVLDELRLVKDEHELGRIRHAVSITTDAFRAAAGAVHPGAGEWEVEAALEAVFRARAAERPAFPSIVASGPNAAVLHYARNARAMRDGELLLIDAGASCDGYAADISRTFPVTGRFSGPQRALYDAVLAARDAAIAAVRPGATLLDVHDAALLVLVEAMVEHELLTGDPAELAEREDAYKHYFPHRTSHWLGLDVHDVGTYADDGEPRTLEPGMTLTIEPGLYIPAADRQLPRDELHPAVRPPPAALRATGIRIEDDVLVTDSGHDVLTADLPAAGDDVEAMIRPGEAW